MRALFQL